MTGGAWTWKVTSRLWGELLATLERIGMVAVYVPRPSEGPRQ